MRHLQLVALVAVPLLALSACGTNNSNGYGGGSTTSSSPAGAGGGSGIHVAATSLGRVLVDGNGRTVYLLTADHPGKSTCSGSCLQYWPPVAPGSSPATGVTATVASTASTGGGKIATVGGWPLYTFAQDQKPGDVNGQGMSSFGGTWYAVSASGQPVKGASGGSSTGHGYGY